MQSTLREIRSFIFSRNNLIAWLAASVICVLVAPFGTGETLSWTALAAYWFTSNALTIATGEAVMMTAASSWITKRVPLMASLLIGGVIASLLVTIIVWGLGHLFFAEQSAGNDFITLLPVVFPVAFVIAVSVGFVMQSAARKHNEETERLKAETGEPATSPFYKRLPVRLGRDLYYLSTQDHYVEVVTAKGKHMVLMRFSDAVDELDGGTGLQIHRSHWVSRDAVTDNRRENGKLLLVMKDGAELPVSRSYLASVREILRL